MNREQFDILLVVLIAAGLILSNTAGRGRPPVKFFARGAVWALCGVLAYEKALWAAGPCSGGSPPYSPGSAHEA